jgi:hypothetical protein
MVHGHSSGVKVRARRAGRLGKGLGSLLDALEPRQLMAVDFAGSFGAMPASVLSGAAQSVTLNLSNNGDTAAGGKVQVAVYAVPEGVDFDVNSAVSAGTFSVASKLAAGASTGAGLTVTVDGGLPAGNYRLVAVINSDGKQAEPNQANNTVESDLFAVAQPDYDLTGSFLSKTKVPSTLVLGTAGKGKVQATITNGGTATLAKKVTVGVVVVARPVGALGSSQDRVLTRPNTTVAVGGLAQGRSKTVNLPVTFPADLAAGAYDLILITDVGAGPAGAGALSESSESNNETVYATSNLTVATAFVDLDIQTASEAFASTVLGGSTANGSVVLENKGNIKASGNVNVLFYATTTGDIADGVIVGQKSFTVSLAPGQTSSALKQTLTLPTGDESQLYTLIAKILPTGFTDTHAENDTQEAGTVTTSPATVDLQIQSASNPFSGSLAGGSTGRGTVKIQNLGTAGASGAVTVTYYASTTLSIEGAVQIGTTTTNLTLAPGKTSGSINVDLVLPNPESTTAYTILAAVTSTAPLTDNNADNNVTNGLGTVSATHLQTVWDNFGDVIKFKSDPGHPIGNLKIAGEDTGTFTTNKGVTGIYHFTWTAAGGIGFFQFDDGSPAGVVKGFSTTYTSSAFFWGGRTVTFSHDSGGAKGQFELNGETIFFK